MSSENVKEMTAEEVLKKFDQESNKREMTGIWNTIITAICIARTFQIYTAMFRFGCPFATCHTPGFWFCFNFFALSR